jgi:hypothetical protein
MTASTASARPHYLTSSDIGARVASSQEAWAVYVPNLPNVITDNMRGLKHAGLGAKARLGRFA